VNACFDFLPRGIFRKALDGFHSEFFGGHSENIKCWRSFSTNKKPASLVRTPV
jgi:hypothetical protein